MNLEAKPHQKIYFKTITNFLAFFGLVCAIFGSFAVFGNDILYLLYYGFSSSTALFLLAFTLSVLPKPWGLAGVLSLLPLSAGLSSMLRALFEVEILAMPNPGLDLVAGLFCGYLVKAFFSGLKGFKSFTSPTTFLLSLSPWPVGLVVLVITFSSVLGVARNLYLSATSTSLQGVLFNLIHFRPLDYSVDYLPLGNWIAYANAAALIILVISALKQTEGTKLNAWIFRPLMLGLIVSASLGIIQAATGLGLSGAQLHFRQDGFGYAAIGMQPDLHAFAAHMLLGVLGLWGYFLESKNKLEKLLILFTFLLCTIGLIASKSRASLVIALIFLVIFGFIYLYRCLKKDFLILAIIFSTAIIIIFISVGLIPGLGWIEDLRIQMYNRRIDSLSDLGGLLGSRFEIWSAVLNMFSAYPLMGVGEGNFFRLSSIISFSRSEFLQLNHGENAHNYFLQVLAENGLVGISVFIIAFIVPFRACNNKQLLLPSAVGLISLFLGNIFAHSFLVRENLLLGAALLGLIYVVANKDYDCPVLKPIVINRKIFLILILVLVSIIYEVYTSFGRLPFKAGADCFVKDLPVYKDNWTTGSWEQRFPQGAKKLEMVLIPNRPNLKNQPLTARFEVLSWELGKGKLPVNTLIYQWNTNESTTITLNLAPEYQNSPNIVTARMQLSSCYTPRDLGVSTDGRRLGVQIKSVHFH